MTKQENIDDPNSCWNKAQWWEQVFILIERDPMMARTIRYWARERMKAGLNKETDAKIQSALEIARKIDDLHR